MCEAQFIFFIYILLHFYDRTINSPTAKFLTTSSTKSVHNNTFKLEFIFMTFTFSGTILNVHIRVY